MTTVGPRLRAGFIEAPDTFILGHTAAVVCVTSAVSVVCVTSAVSVVCVTTDIALVTH